MVYLILVLVVILAFYIAIFNISVKKRNLADEAWHGIDVQLDRRYKLLPATVDAIKGYAQFESDLLERIIKLRSSITEHISQTDGAQKDLQLELSGAVRQLAGYFTVLYEKYPDLKADQNFMGLQKTLVELEDDLADARRYYNGTSKNYNIFITTFPRNIVAKLFNMKEKAYYGKD